MNTCVGDSVRHQPTDGSARVTLSARDDRHPEAKLKPTQFAAMGALTSHSRRCIRHRRPWRNWARARRHARTVSRRRRRRRQTCVVVTAPSTNSGARAPSAPAQIFTPTKNKKCTRFVAMGDSLAACHVPAAATDRGGAVPAYAGMRANRNTQTPASTSNMCGGDSVRDRPHRRRRRTLSALATTFTPAQNQHHYASLRWRDSLAARHVPFATADRGVTAPAHARMRATRQTQTSAQTSNTRGSDSVRD